MFSLNCLASTIDSRWEIHDPRVQRRQLKYILIKCLGNARDCHRIQQ